MHRPRYSDSCISFPDNEFFLRHLVTMNAAGKVCTVLRSIRVYTEVDGLHKPLYATYAVCMTLGMYWYTRFWQGDGIADFYYDRNHVLNKCKIAVIIGACMYYGIFAASSYGHTATIRMPRRCPWACGIYGVSYNYCSLAHSIAHKYTTAITINPIITIIMFRVLDFVSHM